MNTAQTASVVPAHAARMSGVDRRGQIIQVAIQLFSKRGFGGTTTKQIAEAAGVSEAIIFRHFARKRDLYNAILDHKFQEAGRDALLEELQRLADRREDQLIFRSVVKWILEAQRNDPAFHRLILYSGLEGHEFSKILHSRGLPFRTFLRDYIIKRQSEGAFREFDPELLILCVFAMPAHFNMLTRLFGFDVVAVSDEEATETFSQIMLAGIQKKKSKS